MSNTRDDNLELAYGQLRAVQSQRKDLDALEASIKSRIADLIGNERGVIEARGKALFNVTYRNTFSPTRAEQILAPGALSAIRALQPITATVAKRVLPPSTYALCQVEAETPVITLKESS